MISDYHQFEPIELQQAVNDFSEEEISKKLKQIYGSIVKKP